MGKGDKKSRRGKIILGSFGVRRPRKKKKSIIFRPKNELKSEINKEKLIEVKTNVEIVTPEILKEQVVKTKKAAVKKEVEKPKETTKTKTKKTTETLAKPKIKKEETKKDNPKKKSEDKSESKAKPKAKKTK